MNRKWLWLVVGAVLAGWMLTTMFVQAGQDEAKVQWEYRAFRLSGPALPGYRDKLEAKLNELGKEGWELVDWEDTDYVLKRPKW